MSLLIQPGTLLGVGIPMESAAPPAFNPVTQPYVQFNRTAKLSSDVSQTSGSVNRVYNRVASKPNFDKTQGNSARQPLWGSRLINGKSVLDYQGTHAMDQQSEMLNLYNSDDDLHILTVLGKDIEAGNDRWLTGNAGINCLYNATHQARINTANILATGTPPAFVAGQPRLIYTRRFGGAGARTVGQSVDGGAEVTAAATVVGTQTYITWGSGGGSGSYFTYWDGYFAEDICLRCPAGTDVGSQVMANIAYLKQEWGLTF